MEYLVNKTKNYLISSSLRLGLTTSLIVLSAFILFFIIMLFVRITIFREMFTTNYNNASLNNQQLVK